MSKKNRLVPPRQAAVARFEARQEFFSGPLPHPTVLAQYDAIVPGLAERIVALTEKQSEHRQSLERSVVAGNRTQAIHGQWMAYSLAVISLVGGSTLVALGKDAAGIAAIISSAAGLAVVFIYGKRTQRKELTDKKTKAFPAP